MVDASGFAIIGDQWLELDGSLLTGAHHAMIEAYVETGRAAASGRALFDTRVWLAFKRPAFDGVSPLDSLVSAESAALELTAHGFDASSAILHLSAGVRQLTIRGIPAGNARIVARDAGEGRLLLDTLTMDGPLGQIHAGGHVGWHAPYPVDLNVVAENLRLAPWSPSLHGADLGLDGQVDAHISVRGQLRHPTHVTASMDGRKIQLGGLGLGDPSFDLNYERPRLHAKLRTRFGELSVDGEVPDAASHALTWQIDDLSLDPLGQIGGISPISGNGKLRIHSSGALRRPQVDVEVDLANVRVGALLLPPISTHAAIGDSGQIEIQTQAGRLRLEALGDWPGQQLLGASIRLSDDSLNNWLASPWAQQWSGNLQVDLTASGSLRQPRIDGRVTVGKLGLQGRTFGDVGWSMSLDQGTATMSIVALDSTAVLEGSLRLDEGLPFELDGQLHDTRLEPFLALLTQDSTSTLSGQLRAGLHVQGAVARLDSTRVEISLDDLRLSTGADALRLAQPGGATWQGETLRLDTLQLVGSAGRMHVVGVAARRGPVRLHYRLERLALPYLASFMDAADEEIGGELSGFLDVSGTLAAPVIDGGIGVEGLRLDVAQLGDLQARFSSSEGFGRLDDLDMQLPGGGRVSGTASFPIALGKRTSPRAVYAEVIIDSVTLDVRQGLPEDVIVTLSGEVSTRGSEWQARSLDVNLRADHLSVTSGSYIAASRDPILLRWRRGHLQSSATHFIIADTATFGTVSALTDSALLHGDTNTEQGLRLTADHIDLGLLTRILGVERSVRGLGGASVRWRDAWPKARIDVQVQMQDGAIDSVQVDKLRLEGRYDSRGLVLDTLTALASGGTLRGAGFVDRDSLRLIVDLQDFELAPLKHSFKQSAANVSGRLHGNVRVEGPRGDPRWQMQAAIVDGALDVPSFEPALRFSSAMVLLTPDTLIVSGLEDPEGRWSLSANARISEGRATRFQAGMQLNRLRVIIPETMDLTVAGHLEWKGVADSSVVSGDLVVEPGHINEPMSLQTLVFADSATSRSTVARVRSEVLQKVRLDVNLVGRSLLVDNDLAMIPFAAELLIGGSAARPTLKGGLRANEGSIFYMGKEFIVSRAHFEFAEARALDDLFVLFHNPIRLDPAIDFAAQTEVKAQNGNEYDIFLGLGGSLAELDATLTSDPAESEVDILSLLNFGRTGVPMVDARGSMLSTDVNLSPTYLLSATESQFGRVLGLDNVEIDNSVLRPGRLSGSRIVLTKQLGKRTEMIYSTTVGYASQGRVQLQYDLGYHLYLQTQHDARGESGIDLNLKLTFK